MVQPVPNGVLMRMIWQRNAVDYAVNTLHLRGPAAPLVTQAIAQDLANRVSAAFTNSLMPAEISNSVQIDRVTFRDISIANQPEFVATPSPNPIGTDISDPLPGMVALVVTLRTPLVGRSFRGRMYLPGWAETTNLSNGQASVAATTAAQAFVAEIRNQFATPGYVPVVVSRFGNLVERPVPLVNDITVIQVRDDVWDTQRRRQVPGI